MSKKFSASGACRLRHTGTAPPMNFKLRHKHATCEFEVGGASRLTCVGVNKLLQTFTRRHVPRATCRRSTPDRTIVVPAD